MRLNRVKYLAPTVVCGVAGLVLRLHMLQTGIDDKGLLTRGNVDQIALWVLTGGFALLMLLMTRGFADGGTHRQNFPKCRLSGGLAMLGGGMMLAMAARGQAGNGVITLALALMSGLAMVFAGFCRFTGRHPGIPVHSVVSVFFMMVLIERYQIWSSAPELYEYGMQVLCGVALMLLAYQRTCCDVDRICRRKLVFYGVVSCYLCLICLSDPDAPGFYLAAGLWAAGSMGTFDPIEG